MAFCIPICMIVGDKVFTSATLRQIAASSPRLRRRPLAKMRCDGPCEKWGAILQPPWSDGTHGHKRNLHNQAVQNLVRIYCYHSRYLSSATPDIFSRILQPSEVLDFAVGLLHKRAVDGTFSCSVLHRLRLGSVVLCFAAEGRCLGLLGADGPVQTRPIRPMIRVTSRPRKMGFSLFSDWSEDQLATT